MTETACRSCESPILLPILSLGQTPLANALLSAEQLQTPKKTYPLDLVLCPLCSLVQITETVPPEELFSAYLYFSSFSDTVLASAKKLAEQTTQSAGLGAKSLVIEIASNDGYLLKNYVERGVPVLGVEPAQNIARVANKRGIPTIAEFFGVPLAKKLLEQGKKADIIHANNVVAHVADLHGVVEGIAMLLKPNGVAIIENHYVKDLIDHAEFDSIYHEHLCYYSLTSFSNLFKQHGLVPVDALRIPLHGGSLRVFFQHRDGPQSFKKHGGEERVRTMLSEEQLWGVGAHEFYRDFGQKVASLKKELLALVKKLKSKGARIAVYGASAKSTTLLNYFGMGKDTLEYIVDRSSAKQGLYAPGTHLPIYAPEKLLETKPDYALLLSWNFADEILAQQKDYRDRGGRFIIPIPELTIV